jgi:predicted metalloprotease with PDZ domain
MLRSLVALLVLFLGLPVFAQSLDYRVDLTNSASKRVHVTLTPKKMNGETVTFQMPAWAPGAYSVTNYGRYVRDIQAFDLSGRTLAVKQLTENRWSIASAKSLSRIEYDVADSRKDSTSLWFAMAHVDSNLFFANGTALFGYVNDEKNTPSTVTFVKPANWELATALDYNNTLKRDCSFTQTQFKAKDYDELVDAPILAAPELQTRCFDQDGAQYEIALVSNKVFSMDSLQEYTKKIVKTQTDFFGETPFKHYTFLYYAPSFMQMPSMGQGALEHMNSSAYLMMHQPWSQFKEGGLRIISHEFFHLWNVKRIHSSLLGPFDYTKGVRTTSLWLSEGITDYYAHALLARNGLISSDKFLGDLREWYANYRSSKPALTKSLEELSREESDFDMENAVVLYTKGPLVGLMLDLEIRNRTDNKKSLDDIMLALNKEAKQGKYFADEELIGKMGKIVGLDLSAFYQQYIQGSDSIAFEQVLDQMGLTGRSDMSMELAAPGEKNKVEYEFDPGGKMVLKRIPTTSFFALAGFQSRDSVISINGRSVNSANVKEVFASIDRASSASAIVLRGEQKTLTFTLASLEAFRMKRGNLPIRVAQSESPLRAAIRNAIMGKMD